MINQNDGALVFNLPPDHTFLKGNYNEEVYNTIAAPLENAINVVDFRKDYNTYVRAADTKKYGEFNLIVNESVSLCESIARLDGKATHQAWWSAHVRALTGSERNQRVEGWHLDGSYLTVIINLMGKGTIIAPELKGCVPIERQSTPNAEAENIHTSARTHVISEGDGVILSGMLRNNGPPTVHRAPFSIDPRLVFIMFYYCS
jgi:hypothetical protein